MDLFKFKQIFFIGGVGCQKYFQDVLINIFSTQLFWSEALFGSIEIPIRTKKSLNKQKTELYLSEQIKKKGGYKIEEDSYEGNFNFID